MKRLILLTLVIMMGLTPLLNAKKLQDYPAIGTGIAVDADLLRIEDMSASAGSRTKKILLSSLITYIYGDNRRMSGTLTMGANEISGNNFDISGGIISGMTSIAGDLLTIDNITIDGNTISSNTNGDINISPGGTGEVVIAAGNLSYAGTAITATGAEINQVAGADGKIASIEQGLARTATTGITANTTITLSGHYSFSTAGGTISVTLPQIKVGYSQEIIIYLTTAGNDLTIVDNIADSGFVKNDGTITGGGSSVTLNTADEFIYLKSNGSGDAGRWMVMGGYGYTLN